MTTNDVTTNIEFMRKFTVDNISFSSIKESNIHGFGLFATNNIIKSTIIGNLDGQVMNWDFYDNVVNELKESSGRFKNYIFMEWNALNNNTLLVRPFRTRYSLINHSKIPNLEIKYNPIRIVALKDIKENDEFTLDYSKEPLRKEYLEGHGKTYL